MKRMLERLLAGESLTEAEAEDLLVRLTDPELSSTVTGAVLIALRAKGETADEVRGFARGMRRLARRLVGSRRSPTTLSPQRIIFFQCAGGLPGTETVCLAAEGSVLYRPVARIRGVSSCQAQCW